MANDFLDRVGIDVPIVLAPMGGAVGPDLAAAVSNAGGLGLLPLWGEEIGLLREKIRATRERTPRPFGVNLNLFWPQEERLDACLEEGVGIVSLFWGLSPSLIDRARRGNAHVMQTVGSADEARRAADAGADVIVAQGWEAGGHVWGQVATLALVPAVVDAVAPLPVVAAGGIADGRGLAAVLALGASAAWIGTRFLASAEATIHETYQQRVIGATESDTYWGTVFDVGWVGAPHRTLRNSTVKTWLAAGCPAPGERPGEGEVLTSSPTSGPARRYESHTSQPDESGNIEATSMWAGQGVALVNSVSPAAVIVEEVVADARRVLAEAGLRL